jgi:hypothetical protein
MLKITCGCVEIADELRAVTWLSPRKGSGMRRFNWGLAAAASVLMLLAAPQAFATPPSGTPFQGQVYCTTSGCNTQCSQFACDIAGRAMTQFYIDGTRDPNCSANFNNPAYVYNWATNARIGIYIDNEVDGPGSFTNRQALVNCADQEAPQQLILVGEYPAETNADVQPTVANGQGDTVGNMLEWYPYCNGHIHYKHRQQNPPPPSSTGPNGYMSQGAFVPPGCRSGATATEQSNLWNVEWGYVNGSIFTYTSGATTIGDLLGTCEDSVC